MSDTENEVDTLIMCFAQVEVDDGKCEDWNERYDKFADDFDKFETIEEKFDYVCDTLKKGADEFRTHSLGESTDSEFLQLFLEWHLSMLIEYDLDTQDGCDLRDKALGILVSACPNIQSKLIVLMVLNKMNNDDEEAHLQYQSDSLQIINTVKIIRGDDIDAQPNEYDCAVHLENGRVTSVCDDQPGDAEDGPRNSNIE